VIESGLAEAFERLADGLAPVEQSQRIALAHARGRVLARALVARHDLPSSDQAAMDGYAVRVQDLAGGPRSLKVLGRALAGHDFGQRLAPGSCVRIMTGASMPEGADCVVLMEVAQVLGDDTVALPGPIAPGANRRVRGEHLRAGAQALPAGRRLRAADLALACALGEVELDVFRQLRVAIMSTGDELRDAPADLPPGCAFDSNRLMLQLAIGQVGLAAHDFGICPDEPEALQHRIDEAMGEGMDALLISGGAALGDADIVRMLGGVRFVAVRIRPGRGIAVARVERTDRRLLILGLPGNAVAAYVMFHSLALPVLLRLGGATDARPPEPIAMPIACDVQARAGRIDFQRARLVFDKAGRRVAQPLEQQGSAMIRSVADAHALIAVGPAGHYRAGELLPVYLLACFEEAL